MHHLRPKDPATYGSKPVMGALNVRIVVRVHDATVT